MVRIAFLNDNECTTNKIIIIATACFFLSPVIRIVVLPGHLSRCTSDFNLVQCPKLQQCAACEFLLFVFFVRSSKETVPRISEQVILE